MTEAPEAASAIQVFERHRPERPELSPRMLGSPFDAQDAVQETLTRAWRSADRFEGCSQVRSLLYRDSTSVCFAVLRAKERRVRTTEMAPAVAPAESNLNMRRDPRSGRFVGPRELILAAGTK